MNKLFTMARQTGRNMMARMAAMLAMGLDAYPLHAPTSVSVQQWPAPDHRNSTAAADKRCARRRRNIAKRRG